MRDSSCADARWAVRLFVAKECESASPCLLAQNSVSVVFLALHLDWHVYCRKQSKKEKQGLQRKGKRKPPHFLDSIEICLAMFCNRIKKPSRCRMLMEFFTNGCYASQLAHTPTSKSCSADGLSPTSFTKHRFTKSTKSADHLIGEREGGLCSKIVFIIYCSFCSVNRT